MLKKADRLLIQELKTRRGTSRRGVLFTIKAFPAQTSRVRVGVVVPKTVSPKATERNRIKRATYNFFRPRLSALPAQDLLVLAQPKAAKASKDDMIKELQKLIS